MEKNIKKRLLYIIYAIIVCFVVLSIVWLGHFETFRDFLSRVEQSSFDVRQKSLMKYKNPSKDIVIVAIDDESYEYIMDKFGSWPISRALWAKTIDGLEKVNPKNIIFDLLFVKPTNDKASDLALIEEVKKYDNIFLSMNFDNVDSYVRKPSKLDEKLKLKVFGEKIPPNDYISFSNVRKVMEELSNSTKNIGSINVTRDEDGVIREATPVFIYQNDYYPNLSLLVGLDVLGKKEVTYLDNKIILDENHIIPLDNSKRAILNWFGESKTYNHVSFWRVLRAFDENDEKYLKENFENKIIYIGTTATSLSDVKTVPTESNMAGVELHTTFLNNILANNFIKKVSIKVDFVVAILLSFIVGYFVLKIESVLKTFLLLFMILASYYTISLFVMYQFNLWVSLVLPAISTISTFVFIYCEKYLLKVKDYEQTYKLAVTDGLTQLYNHRYFQEQMIIQINNFQRYQTPFSLVMIDIDFFKKFNDTYGHQSGDAVLKQVASILKKNSRTSDIACRYGGEEMTVILTNTQNKEANFVANKICQMVRETKFVLTNSQKVNVTISVGVATMNEKIQKPQELIENCDKCLYKAKENGRNQVVNFEE